MANLLADRETFQAWRDSPQTKDFMAGLSQRRLDLMEAWARGQPMPPEIQASAVLLGDLVDLSHEDFAKQMLGMEVDDA